LADVYEIKPADCSTTNWAGISFGLKTNLAPAIIDHGTGADRACSRWRRPRLPDLVDYANVAYSRGRYPDHTPVTSADDGGSWRNKAAGQHVDPALPGNRDTHLTGDGAGWTGSSQQRRPTRNYPALSGSGCRPTVASPQGGQFKLA